MASTTNHSQPAQKPQTDNSTVHRNPPLESSIRKAVFELCQHEHLSGVLFPLNDILVQPRLLARIRFPGPEESPQYVPVLYQTLPNLFDSPELAAGLPYPAISLDTALQTHSRITINGYAGSGKTTMLADLTSRICRGDSTISALNVFLPIYIHCRNLLFSSQVKGNVFLPLLRYLSVITKIHDEKNISSTLLGAAAEGQLLLLVDGLEELPPESAVKTIQWMTQMLQEFPSIRIVTTTYPFASHAPVNLGFYELSIAPWTHEEKSAFVDRFALAWFSAYQQIESASFIAKWMKTSILPNHPLDLTLACWSAFTGNSIYSQGIDLFSSYLSSISSHPLSNETLIALASSEFDSSFNGISQLEIENLISHDPQFLTNQHVERPGENGTTANTRSAPMDITPRFVLNEYLAAGVLTRTVFGRYFIKSDHLCAALYAQTKNAKLPNHWHLVSQFSFIDSLLIFAACTGKISPQINQWLIDADYPLFRSIQVISHWLVKYPSLTRSLLVQTYKRVILLIQKSALPLSLQVKLLKPLLLSAEPMTISLFKEMAVSPNALHRQTAAFCLSFFSSTASDPILLLLSTDSDRDVQKLACISLAKSWSPHAQKRLVNLLTSGSPEIRQIIGELFAYIPGDGQELLKELAVLPNNPEARKAAVDGLLLIGTDWSKALIKKVNIEDSEWLVRDTAGNAVKLNSVDHLYRPKRNIAPSNLPWLIKFAASKRMGIYTNEFPTEILIKAAVEGDPLVQAAAIETLASDPSPESIHFLKQAFLNSHGQNQELAYSGLVSISRQGKNL